jgi:hypothetical protein
MLVNNEEPIEIDELACAFEDYLTVGSLSEAEFRMGSMFVPEEVASEEEEEVSGTPG